MLGSAAAGCGDGSPSELPTHELGLFVVANADASAELDVITQLTANDPASSEVDFVGLGSGDALYAELEGSQQPLERNDLLPSGLDQYRTRFPGIAGGEELTVSLDRSSPYLDALDSLVVVPDGFELEDAGTQFSIAQDLRVVWSGGGNADAAEVSLSTDCLAAVRLEEAGNPGEIEIPASMLEYAAGVDPGDPCDVVVRVRLIRYGEADPAFGYGGDITAAQVRELDLTATP